MEQLDHLIEVLVQIVLVEYKYGLGGKEGRGRVVGNAEFDNGRSPRWKLCTCRAKVEKGICERRAEGTHLVLCSREVPYIIRSQSPPI